ncbi:MAG TPA: hypothetical protein VGA40_10505 [Candidatus Acidoferrales bacterium]
MNRKTRRWLAGCAGLVVILLVSLGTAGCANIVNKLKARDKLNKGVNAYKSAKFEDAINLFQESKQLDPELLNARLYLATAYASQYIPGAPSEENQARGENAIKEFKDVLGIDAQNLSAIDGIGSILFQMGGTPYSPEKFEESRSYHMKHIEISPNDPEPYYWVGVINWTLAYRGNRELRAEYNRNSPRRTVKDDEPMPDPVREQFVEKYGATIESGIQRLDKAIELRPDYDDAMAYLNLLYRQKADMVTSAEERETLLTRADEIVEKVKEIKNRRLTEPAPKT